ncbi:MAG: DUF3784 domain-containing protein [Lachnospiraceae bacterium]|nr:DUF3784 domain-containing protein [Lachnospiraceae bacterium]
MILAIIMFAIAAVWLILSIRSFKQKGFLLNNAYLFATKEERKSIAWKPYYIQSGVAFLGVAVVFVLIALTVIYEIGIFSKIAIVVAVAMVVYAIVSAVVIEKNIKTKYQK